MCKIQKAKRKAVPMLVSIASPSGFGKTYSALLMAAGMAGKNGKIGFIDTELGRGSMYADDPDIMELIPQGYDIVEISAPFTPEKYIEALEAFKGYDVVVLDSGTHEWEGMGGCQDIAENNKLRGMPNWSKAKMAHKRFMNCLTQLPFDTIICLRAREKTKPEVINGKTQMIDMGMQPICEKNFMFEMTLSMMLDENHKPILTKCPKPLLPLFNGGDNLITPSMGERLKEWSNGGESIDKELRALEADITSYAMQGNKVYKERIAKLSDDEKSKLKSYASAGFWKSCQAHADDADSVPDEDFDMTDEGGFNE